jgi:hypothetical protein
VWHGLRASSPTKRIDGLWIGIGGAVQGDQQLLDRVEEALALITRYDRLRYDRLSRDLKRVWVHVLHGIRGCYNEAFAACELDARFVLAETTSPELIAATIVHEATHSRLFAKPVLRHPLEQRLAPLPGHANHMRQRRCSRQTVCTQARQHAQRSPNVKSGGIAASSG